MNCCYNVHVKLDQYLVITALLLTFHWLYFSYKLKLSKPIVEYNSLNSSSMHNIQTQISSTGVVEIPSDNPNKDLFKLVKQEPSTGIIAKIMNAIPVVMKLKDTFTLVILPMINITVFFIALSGSLNIANALAADNIALEYADYSWRQYPIVAITVANTTSCPMGFDHVVNLAGETVQRYKWRGSYICAQWGNSTTLTVKTETGLKRKEFKYCQATDTTCDRTCITSNGLCPVMNITMGVSSTLQFARNSTNKYSAPVFQIAITSSNTTVNINQRMFTIDTMTSADFVKDNNHTSLKASTGVTYYLKAYYEVPWMVEKTCEFDRANFIPSIPNAQKIVNFAIATLFFTMASSFLSCLLPCCLITSGKLEKIWCPGRFEAQREARKVTLIESIAQDQNLLNVFVSYLNESHAVHKLNVDRFILQNPKTAVNKGSINLSALPAMPKKLARMNEGCCDGINRMRNTNIYCVEICGSCCGNIFSVSVWTLMVISIVLAFTIVVVFSSLSDDGCSDLAMNHTIQELANNFAQQTAIKYVF